ncbi:uncharacterized protein DUF3889 [Cytobacillus horneckiae]|nr:DUF3889 domain-containing protein [Cytobacillus horneckiae]MCM3177618.1 YqzG/YhdC family protein [Cytobacillus horneckiae]MEC1157923.1 DUF3889 domain-containing protein [Cytobacillus horneckiae]MED2937152.1 DUF3889 domain-containing protein [Cytobacillus horneckiae]
MRMKLIFKVILCSLVITSFQPISIPNIQKAYAENDAPAYAKWGRLAMKTAKEKYPNAEIIDYLHIGREQKGKQVVEKFKLWIRENDTEFGLLIFIEFDPKTNQVKTIELKKSEH